MDFIAVILLLAVYYIRPQEWVEAFATLRPAMVTLAFAIITMFLRERGFSFKSLFRTPHDWLIFAFFGWVIFTAESSMDAWSRTKVLFISYLVIVQAVHNMRRLNLLLMWWMGFLTFIALMAIASEYGIDPLGSGYLTHEVNKGRLSLNLSLFENPNALGHSVVPLLLMFYFYFVWKRPLFIKEIGIFLMMIPAYCLYLTQSKGAFLSGFTSTVIGFTFGRPKFVQVIILAMALTVGWTGLQLLPRMEQIKTMHADEGIIVRLQAWKVGFNTMQTLHPKGSGIDTFSSVFQRIYGYPKAPHSSYVQVGTELGYGGLLLFVGIIYCCFRTLLKVRTEDENEERVRRVLLVMLISFCVSSWVIGWGLNLTFYVIAGTIAAFQRLMDEKVEKQIADFKEAIKAGLEMQEQFGIEFAPSPAQQSLNQFPQQLPQPQFQPMLPAVSAAAAANGVVQISTPPDLIIKNPQTPPEIEEQIENQIKKKILRRPRILDIILIWGLTYLVIWFWQYVMKKF
jgi:hypothetical protein